MAQMLSGPGAIVVVNYGSSTLISANIGADVRGLRVVVVDNFSSTDERAAVTQLCRERGWDLVVQPNRGFGAGMNAGVAHAIERGCVSVLLLNPDVSADPDVLLDLSQHAGRERDAVIAPAITDADGRPAFSRGTVDLRRGVTRTRGVLDAGHEPWLSGACLAISVELWQLVGGFSEDYFMYWEDLELSFRCRRAGGRLVVRDDVSVVHDAGGTQGGGGKSSLYRYYNCRNRLLFAARNLPRRRALGWLWATPRYAWNVAVRDGRRAVLRRPSATILPAVRGTCAGVLRLVR